MVDVKLRFSKFIHKLQETSTESSQYIHSDSFITRGQIQWEEQTRNEFDEKSFGFAFHDRPAIEGGRSEGKGSSTF